MFLKALAKSAAVSAAVGGLLAAAVVSGPAVTSAAPTFENVACGVEYPASVATSTALSLERAGGMYGVQNGALVKVSRTDAGSGAPRGEAVIRIAGIKTYRVSLRGGEATVSFPRDLAAGETYTVSARYIPPTCSVYSTSSAADRYYTVKKAATKTSVDAGNIRQGQRPQADVAVRTATPTTAVGNVRVILSRNAVRQDVKTVSLSDGKASVSFARARRAGVYDIDVKYLGTRNFTRSAGDDDLRCSRR